MCSSALPKPALSSRGLFKHPTLGFLLFGRKKNTSTLNLQATKRQPGADAAGGDADSVMAAKRSRAAPLGAPADAAGDDDTGADEPEPERKVRPRGSKDAVAVVLASKADRDEVPFPPSVLSLAPACLVPC